MNSVLAAEVEQALATVAPPNEEGLVVDVATESDEHGHITWRACWKRADGSREFVGPIFQYPREALAFAEAVSRKAGPKVGDPVVVDGTKYRVRMLWQTDDRVDCRTSFGNRWVTVRASQLEWDTRVGVWREAGW